MAKNTIEFCEKCNTYTSHIYVGARPYIPDSEDLENYKILVSLGGYQLPRKFPNDSFKIWKCEQCGKHMAKA